MLLHTIAHYLNEEVKTSNGSKQVHYSGPSEELVFIDEKQLPYTFRLIGNANQVVIIEKANADEKGLKSGLVIIYKTPAMNFEDMPDLQNGLTQILKMAKLVEKTDTINEVIPYVRVDINTQVTEDQGQMHDTDEP